MKPGELIILGFLAWVLLINRRPTVVVVEPFPVIPVAPWSPPWIKPVF